MKKNVYFHIINNKSASTQITGPYTLTDGIERFKGMIKALAEFGYLIKFNNANGSSISIKGMGEDYTYILCQKG